MRAAAAEKRAEAQERGGGREAVAVGGDARGGGRGSGVTRAVGSNQRRRGAPGAGVLFAHRGRWGGRPPGGAAAEREDELRKEREDAARRLGGVHGPGGEARAARTKEREDAEAKPGV